MSGTSGKVIGQRGNGSIETKWSREIDSSGFWYCNLVLVIHITLTCFDKGTTKPIEYFVECTCIST